MKVVQVSIRPTEASDRAGRAALTPELLAATGARYSRSNEGFDAILARIDSGNLDRSVDSIFKMIDYGHQSIADMAPVAMFIDRVSIWLAYILWSICPTAGGQESSTRYIKISPDALAPAATLGIPADEVDEWRASMATAFDAYRRALAVWEAVFDADPAVARIPASLLADESDKAAKKVARMRRNFAFDRARYFLPVAAATNVMLVMSARAWVQLCQVLLSHPIAEAQQCGALMREELGLAAPRLLRHAVRRDCVVRAHETEFQAVRCAAERTPCESLLGGAQAAAPATAFLDVFPPSARGECSSSAAQDLADHDNRYAPFGEGLRRTAVRFGWSAVAMAEIRDLNRHRTGSKYCPLRPVGFYCADEELPENEPNRARLLVELSELAEIGRRITADGALSRLMRGRHDYVFWSLLGTQYPFEHTTTADKFLYEAELRTGVGAHFRYAQHLRETLALWYERYPETRGLVLEGAAEPE